MSMPAVEAPVPQNASVTAQEIFRQMMRYDIAPALRALGFKGSGQVYVLPSDTHWAMLNFQKSALRSDAEQIFFAVNFDVSTKEEWNQRRRAFGAPERPSPSWFSRMGIDDQSPHGGGVQHWWHLRVESPIQALVDDVITRIKNEALPAMRALMEKPLA